MKTTLSRLPQFANIVDAAQFLHDAVDGFYSIENIGSTKISWDVKAFVEHETQSVSFGGAAIFHLLYTEAAPLKWAGVNYNSPHWEWLDGNIHIAARELGVSRLELAGWGLAMDLLGKGMELRLAAELLTGNLYRMRDCFTFDDREIERQTNDYCNSLKEFIATQKGE
tara:strand:+ start:31940 stop:32443 length:504 start_codon:yes stop_codon:yes gene_type:complete